MQLISNKYIYVNFLYNITDISNLKSIVDFGILSKNTILKTDIDFVDLSNPEVQNRRNQLC